MRPCGHWMTAPARSPVPSPDFGSRKAGYTGAMTRFLSLEDLVGQIADGAHIAIPPDYSFVAMRATRVLIRRKARNLRLLGVPTSGLQADLLIGAGCVAEIEAAGGGLGGAGGGARGSAAARARGA